MKTERTYLFNRLNKAQALEKIAGESFDRKTFSFYRYVGLDDPQALRDELFAKWQSWDALGRIYLSTEGINAQMNIPEMHWDEFVADLHGRKEFADIPFKVGVEQANDSFWKLIIKVRKRIVADGLTTEDFDSSNVGEHLDAATFNKLLDDKDTVCVDMRNFYESEIGHFEGAICPDATTFAEELPLSREMLKGKEDKNILIYCTGGIRCEKASAYLRNHGFNRVSQLHGGIIQYAHEIEEQGLENKFKGKNFVFDERTSEAISGEVISKCHQCGNTADTHVNCSNEGCNLLFIQCEKCSDIYKGACTDTCKEISILPLEEKKKIWKKGSKKRIYGQKLNRLHYGDLLMK